MKKPKNQPTAKTFLRYIAEHQLAVIRDDGIDRHIRFRRPNTIVANFDLITWSGYLCISGDMGTYVFSRIPDMFEFFRSETGELKINEGYWAEKVQAIDRHSGVTKYSPDKFRQQVKWWLDSGEASRATRKAATEQVLSHADDGEFWAMRAATEFEYEDFRLSDFWEANLHEYTYQFVWCCYAMVWGIQQYDKSKEAKVA